MNSLYNYLTEKLKLSDINKNNLDGRGQWVDANRLKFEDLAEGYILKFKNGELFATISIELAKKFFDDNYIQKEKPETKVLVCISNYSKCGLSYVPLFHYKGKFPTCDVFSKDYSIEEVYTRKKEYKNAEDIIYDLKNIEI